VRGRRPSRFKMVHRHANRTRKKNTTAQQWARDWLYAVKQRRSPLSSQGSVGSRVAAAICILGSATRGGVAADGLPGDFCGFFARLLEVAVVAPQVGSVLAAAYEDATGPGCADASGVRVVLELRLGELICGAIVLELLDVAF
jgi:hypothetical protein